MSAEYVAMSECLGVTTTIAVKCRNQNGNLKSVRGHLKRRLNEYLLLRRSRDFAIEAVSAPLRGEVARGHQRAARDEDRGGVLVSGLRANTAPAAEPLVIFSSQPRTPKIPL